MNRFNIYANKYDAFMKMSGFYKPNIIINHLKLKGNEILLDIGGGTGYIANKISKKVDKVIVLDTSHEMLKKVKNHKNIETCCAKAQSIPFPDNFFDSLICIDVLHHIKEIDSTLVEMKRVLKPNGKVLIQEFNIKGIWGHLFWVFEKTFIDNSKFIKPEKLLYKMKNIGFRGRIVKISNIEYIFIGEKDKC